MKRKTCNPMDDALVLLQYVAKNPEGKQTYNSLSEGTGIPMSTIYKLVQGARKDEYGSILNRAAHYWRFDFDLHRQGSNRIISAVFRGYGDGAR